MSASRRLWYALAHACTERLEAWLGVFALLFGAQIAVPATHTWQTAAFRPLADTGVPETGAGLVIAAVGVLQLVAVATDRIGARLTASVLAGFLWSFLAVMFWLGSPNGTGWVSLAVFGIALYALTPSLAILSAARRTLRRGRKGGRR